MAGVPTARYLGPNANGHGTREERDRLLAEAEVILGGFPFVLDMRRRAPMLKWFHQRPAGASNLIKGDLWGSDVVVTTSRGVGNTLQIAEYAVASMLHFAKGLHRAAVDRSDGEFGFRAYRPILVQGKTACIVGAGGIGLDVGRLCAALGMRVLGTRRNPTGAPAACRLQRARRPRRSRPVSPSERFRRHLLPVDPRDDAPVQRAALRRHEGGAVLVNVARGEIVDEQALADALARNHLRGAALDVYVGEFERPPRPELWSDPRVLITPHISSISDEERHGAIDIFCDNLRAYLDGRPLRNVIDWVRGY